MVTLGWRRVRLGTLLGVLVAGVAVTGMLRAQEENSVATMSQASAPGAGAALSFQTDLFTGRFTSGVAIRVPAGRQGSAPSVSLSYSSGGGNGWVGVGWHLDQGFIQRRTDQGSPVRWSNPSGAPENQYDDSKGFEFCFQGTNSKLLPTGVPNEWGAEVESKFFTFRYLDPSWEVVDRNGNRFLFGDTAESRVESVRPGWPAGVGDSTFRWSLSKSTDANGNTIEYEYFLDDFSDVPGKVAVQQYLSEIRYNGHASGFAPTHCVQFLLEPRTTDSPFDFLSGHRMETRHRLREIVVTVGSQIVRRYELSYVDSPSTGRSLLQSVQEFGNQGGALPPTCFQYYEQEFGSPSVGGFGPSTAWPGALESQGQVGQYWASVGAYGLTDDVTHLGFFDVDADGFPDRVMPKMPTSSTTPHYVVQFNSANGFLPGTYDLGLFDNTEFGNYGGRSVRFTGSSSSNSHHNVVLIDLNGDGFSDRITRESGAGNQLHVQYSDSGTEYPAGPSVSSIDSQGSSSALWKSPESTDNGATLCTMLDIDGDGLADRVMRVRTGTLDHFLVQRNNGSGFDASRNWPILNQGMPDSGWSAPYYRVNEDLVVGQYDMNGDGLVDRVMRERTGNECGGSAYDHFVIQFNNGTGYESSFDCWPISSQGETSAEWNSPIGEYKQNIGTSNDPVYVWPALTTLRDVNGDGLVDRVMRKADGADYDRFVVQLNHGAGFSAEVDYWFDPSFHSQGSNSAQGNSPVSRGGFAAIQVISDLVDVNGDGLVDRAMRQALSPYTNLFVELSQGPFPDLLHKIDNSLGGEIEVEYEPTSSYDNRDRPWTTDPWSEGAQNLLPFVDYTVSAVTLDDGMTQPSRTSYSYQNGYFDAAMREFRGFNCVSETDAAGTTTRTYFHQGGGIDKSADGEYQDQGSIAKKGQVYRTETWGSDALKYSETFNKVEEIDLGNGRCFPFVSQIVLIEYEGLGTAHGRATARSFDYDSVRVRLKKATNWGEVDASSFDPNDHSFDDVLPGGQDDAHFVFHEYYDVLANPEITDKLKSAKTAKDAAGSQVLRYSEYAYHGQTGNLSHSSEWLDTLGPDWTNSANWITETFQYDPTFGNLTLSCDGEGLETEFVYDANYYSYAETTTLDPSGLAFMTVRQLDPRSGKIMTTTDLNGVVSEQLYDEFYRPTDSYVHLPGGAGTIWQASVAYSLGGVASGVSFNQEIRRANDAFDSLNGHESIVYTDGFGRVVQLRVEAEPGALGEYRVTSIGYDLRGAENYRARTRFGDGSGFETFSTSEPGTHIAFDPIGRRTTTTPPDGVPESPTEPAQLLYVDAAASDPWARIEVSPGGRVLRSRLDAFGRVRQLEEVTSSGTFITKLFYDDLGNLVRTEDSATPPNITTVQFDSLGRKVGLQDPDMGDWSYEYDRADRLVSETDAKGQFTTILYDSLGRDSVKQIHDMGGSVVETVSYEYDQSPGTVHNVFPGQLFRVTDGEGWVKFGYDVRGRVERVTRHLNKTGKNYVVQYEHNDVGNPIELTYPNNVASLSYEYTSGGKLERIVSSSGTGGQHQFYLADPSNEVNQLTRMRYGNNVTTDWSYYALSGRLQNILVSRSGTVFQDLTYQHYANGDLAAVTDNTSAGGSGSGTFSLIQYDDLQRLTSYQDVDGQSYQFDYDSIGNMLLNGEQGGGAYDYPTNGVQPHAVLSANGNTYLYDANGNMTQRNTAAGNQVLRYDEQNRLVEVTNGASVVRFGYDYAGNRLWREANGELSLWIEGVYEEKKGRKYCHVVADSRRVCVFEPSLVSVVSRPVVGAPAPVPGSAVAAMSFAVRILKQPKYYYYHPDHLSSTNLVTNRVGNVIQRYQNSAYGQEKHKSNSSGYDAEHKYTDQILDEATGLYYYNARYYDPALGRFIQPDTIVPDSGDPQALNRYSYVFNNPLNFTDPSGNNPLGLAVGMAFNLMMDNLYRVIHRFNWYYNLEYGSIPEYRAMDFALSSQTIEEKRKPALAEFRRVLFDELGYDFLIGGGWATPITYTKRDYGFMGWRSFFGVEPEITTLTISNAEAADWMISVQNKEAERNRSGMIVSDFGTQMMLGGLFAAGVKGLGGLTGSSGAVTRGTWVNVNEAMSARAAAYQAQITGQGAARSFLVNGVKFDGRLGSVLLEAKGPGYAWAIRGGQFRPWYEGAKGLVSQAMRQVQAAGGTRIRWHVAEKPAAEAIRNLFKTHGIKGIKVIHTPVKKP